MTSGGVRGYGCYVRWRLVRQSMSRSLKSPPRSNCSYVFFTLPRLSFVAIFVLAGLADARQKTDVVVMKNGDRYTCEIVSLSQGQLKVKTVNTTGSVLLDWMKVDRINSTQYLRWNCLMGAIWRVLSRRFPQRPAPGTTSASPLRVKWRK